MLRAMMASTGAGGTCTNPSVAAVSVMLCDRVNALTVFINLHTPYVIRSSESTKSR